MRHHFVIEMAWKYESLISTTKTALHFLAHAETYTIVQIFTIYLVSITYIEHVIFGTVSVSSTDVKTIAFIHFLYHSNMIPAFETLSLAFRDAVANVRFCWF